MKIGVLAYRQYPFISANTSIAYTVGDNILNHEVIYIGRKQDECQNTVSDYNNKKIRFLNEKVPSSNWLRVKEVIRKYLGDSLYFSTDARALRKIIKEEMLEALICIIAPNDNLELVLNTKLNIPIFVYQLDPYYNFYDKENPILKKKFVSMLSKVEYLFTTRLLYQQYKVDKEICAFLNKISVLEFPKLVQPKEMDLKKTNSKSVKMLYAGTLYKGIRSPKILIKLKENLPKEYEIVFCGSCDEENDMASIEKAGIVCKGYCSQNVLAEEIQKADALINIGNTVKNQLGSKIVDYIATGKPIVNIAQFKECSTKEVLDNYSLHFNIDINDIDKLETLENLNRFIIQHRDERIDFKILKEKYAEFTPEYVAGEILDRILERR